MPIHFRLAFYFLLIFLYNQEYKKKRTNEKDLKKKNYKFQKEISIYNINRF